MPPRPAGSWRRISGLLPQRVNLLTTRLGDPDNGPVGAREERFALNEALFREVNERVVEVAANYVVTETESAVDFTCECGRTECSETMLMTIARVRGDSRTRDTFRGRPAA